jgi:fermentation-respiration switch protein FrsA (DUF1100 family)
MRSIHELLLFQPSRFPSGDWEPDGLNYQDVWLQAADGTRIHAWYLPAENPRAVVLYAHGNAGNLAWRAKLFKYLQEELQLSILAFDYRGYGRSAGKPTIDGALQDARAARAKLAEVAAVPPGEIVLMGRSLGGAVAIHLAAESAPRGLIVESTFTSLREVARKHYARLSFVVPPHTLNNVAKIAEYDGPLLYSHGTADRVVPIALGEQLFEAAAGPKTFHRLPGLDHNTRGTPEYYRILEQFVAQLPETQSPRPQQEARP